MTVFLSNATMIFARTDFESNAQGATKPLKEEAQVSESELVSVSVLLFFVPFQILR